MSAVFHTIHFGNYQYSFYNWIEFILLYFEVFILGEYKIQLSNKNPVIFDCGSHIGLSLLYFKSLSPNARIYSFEPYQKNIRVLERNIQKNHLKKIHLVKAALGSKEGKSLFYSTNSNSASWGNTLYPTTFRDVLTYASTVRVVRLSKYITKHIDLLKMDIEGAELLVLNDIEPHLSHIDNILVEIHNETDPVENRLAPINKLLSQNGFTTKVTKPLTISIVEKFQKYIRQKHTDRYMMHAYR